MSFRTVLLHFRHHAVGYVALFVALGGTSYAAFGLRNHSIDPNKLNPRRISGYVRAWATVRSNATVISSSSRKVTVRMHEMPVPPGDYDVFWHTRPTSRCTAVVSIDARAQSPAGMAPGSAAAETFQFPRQGEETTVLTYDGTGQSKALPFDVALLCATPH
jgi:hypothetical protein